MHAVAFESPGKPLKLVDVPVPAAAPGDLVFKVEACGICGSDLHAADTPGFLLPGVVLGHEFCGTVTEVGAGVDGWAKGDRLVALPGRPCGACAACEAGRPVECTALIMQGLDLRLPGAYAEYASCLAGVAIKIPAALPREQAALVEPLAVGLGAYKSAAVPDGADVLVVGAGVIGLAVAKWARFYGADVGISDLVPARLERARAAGVDTVIDASRCDNAVAEYTRLTGRTPSVIFECVGRPIIHTLIEMAPVGAHLVMVGTGMQPDSFTVVSAALKRLRMSFALGYEPPDFGFVLRMIASGRIETASLISGVVPLSQVPEMFETLRKPNDHCKVLITP